MKPAGSFASMGEGLAVGTPGTARLPKYASHKWAPRVAVFSSSFILGVVTCNCMGVQPACKGFSSSAGMRPKGWLT